MNSWRKSVINFDQKIIQSRYFCTALNFGLDLQITKVRPLRLTILQSLCRFLAVFNELTTFMRQLL